MDATTGKWERYQCDSGAEPIKEEGTVTAIDDRQMATTDLLVCMDVNIISKKGAIKLHIPPSHCSALVGYTGTEKPTKFVTDSMAALTKASKQIMKTHAATMFPFAVEVVHGAGKGFDAKATVDALNHLFGITFTGVANVAAPSAKGAITRIDLSPPALFVDGKDSKITVPGSAPSSPKLGPTTSRPSTPTKKKPTKL